MDSEQRPEGQNVGSNALLGELPPEGSPLRTLGQRLTDLLDDDQWNNCEPLLLAVAAQLRDAQAVLEMVETNHRVRAGEKRKAWNGDFVVLRVREVLASFQPNAQVNAPLAPKEN